jgi:hypothetical protein
MVAQFYKYTKNFNYFDKVAKASPWTWAVSGSSSPLPWEQGWGREVQEPAPLLPGRRKEAPHLRGHLTPHSCGWFLSSLAEGSSSIWLFMMIFCSCLISNACEGLGNSGVAQSLWHHLWVWRLLKIQLLWCSAWWGQVVLHLLTAAQPPQRRERDKLGDALEEDNWAQDYSCLVEST